MDLKSFLDTISEKSQFKAMLNTRCGCITFMNSGRRGDNKSFQMSLDSLLITLKDIRANIVKFKPIKDYNEGQWRDAAPAYYSDATANTTSTVQTKPLFSLLSKLIIWGNQNDLMGKIDSDNYMAVEERYLDAAISRLEELCQQYDPDMKRKTNLENINLQQIYYGAPGTGKSHIIKETIADESVVRTTFHPDSDYSTFVGAYKPTTKEVKLRDVSGHVIKEEGKDVTENKIVYEFVSQAFLQAYIQAWKFYSEAVKDGDVKKQFLVIEEINRGNCAQIFGDLFQLLDRNESGFSDYPIHADNDMQKHLAHAFAGLTIAREDEINACYREKDIVTKVLKGELLLLPDNLYIWATMNTSDQSLFPIDSAFKRRWDWQYIPITDGGKGWKIEADGNLYDWWQFLEKMNDKIGSITNSEDKKLGYFFCKTKDGVISAETFVGKVIFYIWNDVFKDFAEESGDLFRDSDGTLLTFNKFYTVGTDGKPYVVEEKIEKLLLNVGLTPDESQDVDSNEEIDDLNSQSDGSQRDRTKYSINGEGSYSKKRLPFEVVKLYVENNPGLSAQELSDIWGGLETMIRQIVITSTDYDQKLSTTSDSRFNIRYYDLDLANGEKIYVYNQFKPETITDFITKVNNQKWVHIAKVEE